MNYSSNESDKHEQIPKSNESEAIKEETENATNKKSMNLNNLFDLFKESLKKVCSDSKVHGLSNIADNQNIIIKLMWSILFLMALGTSIYCN